MARTEAPTTYAKAVGTGYSPRPSVTAPAPDSTDGQSTVVEEAREADPLVARVADAVRDGRVVEDGRGLGVTPREERVDDGSRALVADPLFLLARGIVKGALDAEQRTDEAECDLGALGIGGECLEEVPSRMGPAIDLDDISGLVEVVVDDVGV